MDETEPKEQAYSGEQTKITGPDSLRNTTEAANSSEREKTATARKQTLPTQMTALPEITRTGGTATGAELAEFLKSTKRVWLGLAGGILVVMTVVTVVTRMSEQARNAREKRQEQAVLDVMPEKVIARCGPPAEDVTKEMYPVVLRTMSYQHGENEKIVFEFSRTAEEKSEWVFLSMKDQSGARNFETTEAKIVALPCLDSKK